MNVLYDYDVRVFVVRDSRRKVRVARKKREERGERREGSEKSVHLSGVAVAPAFIALMDGTVKELFPNTPLVAPWCP